MADNKYYLVGSKSADGEKSWEDEDFEEGDVWSVVLEKAEDKRLKGSSSSSSRLLPSDTEMNRPHHSTSPMEIPRVSKMRRKKNDEDDGEVDDDKVPPHEWIANKLAKTEISSFSVCEGAGRTLKGRDLSKVRNAVLSKTGFLE